MKAGWQEKKLGDVCHFVRGPFGGSLKKSCFVEKGFAVYEQQHAIYDQFKEVRYFVDDTKFQEMRRFEVRANDLIMSCSGTMGKVAIVPKNIRRGIINQALLKLTPSKLVVPEFLKYWMDSIDFQRSLKEQAGGAAIQNVASVSVLKNIQISLPSIQDQQRLVAILDEAFDGITAAKANAEKNLQNARELFDLQVLSVFAQKGNGWVEKKLQEVCEKITDGTHQTPKYFESGYIFLSSRNVTSGRINWEKIKYIDEKQHLEMQRRVAPRAGDVLLAKNGTTGVAAMVDRDVAFDIYVSLALLRARPEMLPAYLLHFINSPNAKLQFNNRLKGVGVPNLHLEEIREVNIAFPKSLAEQQAVVSKLDNFRAETQRLESLYQQKLTALAELKKSLLHEAFSGKL